MPEQKTPWYKNGLVDSLMKSFAGFIIGILIWILTFGFPLNNRVAANTNGITRLVEVTATNSNKIETLSTKLENAATKDDLRQAVLDIREYIKALVPPSAGK